MRQYLKILFQVLAASLIFVACSKGDGDGSSKTDNSNANNTDKSQYATRLEVPRLKDGNAYQLLVKTTSQYGVNLMIEWDKVQRAQRWSCWVWTKENNVNPTNWSRNSWVNYTWGGVTWNGDPFQPDPELEADYRTELSDYTGSGYNRGHICASQDRISGPDVNGPTFYLSNMQPQIYSFNAGVWEKMEETVRSWAKTTTQNDGKLYVCKGGTIYDVTIDGTVQTGVLTKNPGTGEVRSLRMPVPKYFFMAVLKETSSGLYSSIAFWAEHKPDYNTNLAPYAITIDELESRTGIDFFCNLPDHVEKATESSLDLSTWNLK